MGTFHDDRGDLHGITIVIDTAGSKIYIGRCHEERDADILLLDVGEHDDGANGQSKADYVAKAAKFGHWPVHKKLVVPRSDIVSITRLGELARD